MKKVTEFPTDPAVERAVLEEAAKQQAIADAMKNAEIIPVTLTGILRERDADGGARAVKQEFQVPVPKGTVDFTGVSGIVWNNFSQYGGLNVADPTSKNKFYFFPMVNFEKITLEFGVVAGIIL
jgi:hypothetical protein